MSFLVIFFLSSTNQTKTTSFIVKTNNNGRNPMTVDFFSVSKLVASGFCAHTSPYSHRHNASSSSSSRDVRLKLRNLHDLHGGFSLTSESTCQQQTQQKWSVAVFHPNISSKRNDMFCHSQFFNFSVQDLGGFQPRAILGKDLRLCLRALQLVHGFSIHLILIFHGSQLEQTDSSSQSCMLQKYNKWVQNCKTIVYKWFVAWPFWASKGWLQTLDLFDDWSHQLRSCRTSLSKKG